MAIKTAGQPTISPFEVIRTQYWFNNVKKEINKEVLVECHKAIEKILRNKQNGLKYDRSKLRTLKNKITRLSGEGNYKNSELKYSDMQKHLEKKEIEIDPDKLISTDGVGKFSGKVWSRYATGQYTPSRILDDLTIVYPESKLWYMQGPYNLFKILESNTLNEALNLIKETFFHALSEPISIEQSEFVFIQNENNNTKDKNAYKEECGQIIKKLEDELIQLFDARTSVKEIYIVLNFFINLQVPLDPIDLFDSRYQIIFKSFRGLNEEGAACLCLSLAFILYKFLGDTHFLSKAITCYNVLDILEKQYGIKVDNWYKNNLKNPSGISAVFMEMKNSKLHQRLLEELYEEDMLALKILESQKDPNIEIECDWNKNRFNYSEVKIDDTTYRSLFKYSV
jgi:hypothetical protein